MKRHLKWIVPLLLVPVIFYGAMAGATRLAGVVADQPGNAGAAVGVLALMAIAFIGPIVALVAAIRAMVTASRQPKVELARENLEQQSAGAWEHARALRLHLLGRQTPHHIETWDVVANPGEVFFYDVPAEYARHYGQDVNYSQSSGFYFGQPAFVIAALGISAIGNARRRSAAELHAQAQWRDHQPVRLIVSNQRLICRVGPQWVSFYFNAMSAVFPEVDHWTLIVQFNATSALMLRGDYIPAAAVITTMMTHGIDALEQHPSLRRLGGTTDGAVERS